MSGGRKGVVRVRVCAFVRVRPNYKNCTIVPVRVVYTNRYLCRYEYNHPLGELLAPEAQQTNGHM